MNKYILQTKNLTLEKDGKTIFKNINLEIESGQIVALIGPSGSGKSTLLKTIAGWEKQTSGEIFLDSVNITNTEIQKRETCLLPQTYDLFENLNVEQNISMGVRYNTLFTILNTLPQKQIDALKVHTYNNKYPRDLSGGQRQRAAFVRTIYNGRKVTLLDEPFSALDRKFKNKEIDILKNRKQYGYTVILTAHEKEEVVDFCDVIISINDGEIIETEIRQPV